MRWKIFVALLFSENRRINAASLTNSMVRTLETGHCRVEHIPGSDTEQSGQDSWAPLCAGPLRLCRLDLQCSVIPSLSTFHKYRFFTRRLSVSWDLSGTQRSRSIHRDLSTVDRAQASNPVQNYNLARYVAVHSILNEFLLPIFR
ncbi:hypothetical protein EV361DRAFT_339090 [Lentinula raphanica]|nr:hypothetical protein EV361DRAFT_339090 [Lentinula raphanica]